jgi:hypothetical protein
LKGCLNQLVGAFLYLPYKGKGVTEGGIKLVKETIDRETLATVVAYVVAMGPDCYKDTKRFAKTLVSKRTVDINR